LDDKRQRRFAFGKTVVQRKKSDTKEAEGKKAESDARGPSRLLGEKK
jgi:hypothetical protein